MGVDVRNVILVGAAIAAAGAFAITGAATATTSTRTEHFSFIDTSNNPNSDVYSAIATGDFTAGGTAILRGSSTTLRLSDGTITAKSKAAGRPKTSTNLKLCLETYTESATYTILRGTGAYTGITGSGKSTIKVTEVGPIVKGKCSTKADTVASQTIVTASGPLSLP
jgi:hypothetical protein